MSVKAVAVGAVWVALIASGVTVLALPSIAIWFSPSPGEAASDLLKAAFGWPFFVLAVAILIAAALRADLSSLLDAVPVRLARGGRTEAIGLRLPSPSRDGRTALATGQPPAVAAGVAPGYPALAAENLAQAGEDAARQRACGECAADARRWRQLYLSTFPLVTEALQWFGKRQSPVPESAFHRAWRRRLPDPIHRQYLLATLLDYRLLDRADDNLDITVAGKDLLAFAGLQPAKPASRQRAPSGPRPTPAHGQRA